MTKRDKLINRFLNNPNDFTWQELETLLASFGYELIRAGKTGGSRVRFVHSEAAPIILHKPHPKPVLKRYQMDDILTLLKQEGFL